MGRWLITRPEQGGQATVAALTARGHEAVLAPVLTVEAVDAGTMDLAHTQALLFTSANGVDAFARSCAERGHAVLAVGGATAAAARSAGFERVESADGDGRDLARLAASSLSPDAGAVLHASGEIGGETLREALASAGFRVRRAVVYRTVAVPRLPPPAVRALEENALTGVCFFSPRTARVFGSLAAEAGVRRCLGRLAALCLSPAVAHQVDPRYWASVRSSDRPDSEALLRLIDSVSPCGVR